jgi:protein TonB
MNKNLLIVGLTVMVNLIFAQSNGDKPTENTCETKVKQIPWQMISSSDESIPVSRIYLNRVDTNSKSKEVSKPKPKNQPKLPAKNAKGKTKARTKTKPQMYFIPPVLKEDLDSDTIKMTQLVVGDSKATNNVGYIGEHNKSKRNEISNLKGDGPMNTVGDPFRDPFPADGPGGDDPYIKSHEVEPIANPDVKASFPGGEAKFYEYLRFSLQFPARCMEEGISGSVKLRFVVNIQGNISDIKVIEETKSCPEFTKEAIRVIRQSPKWIPGQIKGKFVNSWMMIPVTFKLD